MMIRRCALSQGSVVVRERKSVVVKTDAEGRPIERERSMPAVMHCDIIKGPGQGGFWDDHPRLLE